MPTDLLLNELRAACERMGRMAAIDDLAKWRTTSDTDRLNRLEYPVLDPAAAAERGGALLSELGIR